MNASNTPKSPKDQVRSDKRELAKLKRFGHTLEQSIQCCVEAREKLNDPGVLEGWVDIRPFDAETMQGLLDHMKSNLDEEITRLLALKARTQKG